ncbi:hypothetical protein J4761_19520 [Burkholderia pseudomallei]|uniref:hypothetical protein n=1 Tax=Burkholderia pseudomallei TaxID=28450 RepID=UPI001AAF3C3D|nr:hypothetical protein [Burkholderia pseudomallei]MBO2962218.1 hypothetical protein [Burkholderia pseudomallei]MBO7788260.1 hypothetical protein [Burkholderia pseudomallei]MBO7841669.1 hypothetical protein [Burkholderia pseudomallei]
MEIQRYLTKRYVALKPGKIPADFAADICSAILERDDDSVDHPLDLIKLLLQSDDPSMPLEEAQVDPIVPLILSATYLLRALRAEKQGQHETGWNCLVDATYFCGLAQGGQHVDLVYAEAATETSSARGKAGADQRYGDKYESVVQYAHKLARERRPKNGWPSRNQAVKAILEDVSKFSEKTWKKLTEQQAPDTIHGWLKKMPDAAEFFTEGKK